jgi:predicted  nucleic acid-binding Zn-ribbon protein
VNPQDLNNISSWLQELLRLVQDTHTQLVDMRNENRQVMDEIKGVSARMDQKDTDIIRLVDTMRGQIDVLRGEVTSVKSAVESTNSHLDSKVNDLKSTLSEIRRTVN